MNPGREVSNRQVGRAHVRKLYAFFFGGGVRKITRCSFDTSLSQSVRSTWGTADQSIRRNAPEDFNLHEISHWRDVIKLVTTHPAIQ